MSLNEQSWNDDLLLLIRHGDFAFTENLCYLSVFRPPSYSVAFTIHVSISSVFATTLCVRSLLMLWFYWPSARSRCWWILVKWCIGLIPHSFLPSGNIEPPTEEPVLWWTPNAFKAPRRAIVHPSLMVSTTCIKLQWNTVNLSCAANVYNQRSQVADDQWALHAFPLSLLISCITMLSIRLFFSRQWRISSRSDLQDGCKTKFDCIILYPICCPHLEVGFILFIYIYLFNNSDTGQ